MQRLTTREPDADQLEVAIAALRAVPGFATETAEEANSAQSAAEQSFAEETAVSENTMIFPVKNPQAEHE